MPLNEFQKAFLINGLIQKAQVIDPDTGDPVDWDALGGSSDAASVAFTPTGAIAATDVQAAIAELDSEKQPLDSDLTAIAALTTTATGRSLLAAANAAAIRAISGAETAGAAAAAQAASQPLDSDLTAIAALSTTSFGRSLLAAADAAALRTLAATDATYQPLDSDLTSIAALSTTSFGRGLLALADATALGANHTHSSSSVAVPFFFDKFGGTVLDERWELSGCTASLASRVATISGLDGGDRMVVGIPSFTNMRAIAHITGASSGLVGVGFFNNAGTGFMAGNYSGENYGDLTTGFAHGTWYGSNGPVTSNEWFEVEKQGTAYRFRHGTGATYEAVSWGSYFTGPTNSFTVELFGIAGNGVNGNIAVTITDMLVIPF
jgi:hypothetical protein